jgi:glycerol kinase
MTYILAIDQSTSASKAVLFDEQGTVIDKATREHRQIYPQPGWVEHDAAEIWQNVLIAVRQLADQQGDKFTNIAGLSVTNQRETFVVFDRRTGAPLHNAIVWQCRRGDAVCQALREQGAETTICQKTGLKLDTYFSGSKLRWLIDQRREIREKIAAGDALIGTIDAYLIYRLTSGSDFSTDVTNASRTLLFDIHELQWDDELCSLFHVPRTALPTVRESFASFGETDAGGALGRPVPICGVMGDSQASLFAQRCYAPGMAKATFGSGTSVLLNVGHALPVTGEDDVSALAWAIRGEPTYALEGLINYSSATIAWLRDQLQLIGDPAESQTLAESVADNGGVYFVPAFAGLSAPYWSADARAAIVGMTAYTNKAHVVRAALESIAYQIRDVLEAMRNSAGIAPSLIHADGGPTRNEFLMQFTADLLQLELNVADVPESSALGAAMAGMLGLGKYASLEELANLPRPSRGFVPQMSRARADDLYAGWQAAVERVL